LLEIEKSLQANHKSLQDFPTMPYPQGYVTETLGNRLIYDEKHYNLAEQLIEFNKLYASLTGYTSSLTNKYVYIYHKKSYWCLIPIFIINR
jgi:hypothetical protein